MLHHKFRALLTSATIVGVALAGMTISASVSAQDVVRLGLQIGAAGALRTTLPEIGKKHNLKFEIKNFRSSTHALLALEQGEIHMANTTAQHLVRAISEGIDVVWVSGWGGGYNVLIAAKGFKAAAASKDALKAAIMKRKGSDPVKIGVPTGSMQHANLLKYFKSIGVNGEKDVDIVNISFPNHPRALGAGEVDMALTIAGFGQLAMEKSGGVLVAHLFNNSHFGKQEIGFIVQRKLIKENPGLVQRIVNAQVEAMDIFMNNMDQQIAYEKKYSRFPPSVIEATERKFLRYNYRTNVADLKSMAKLLKSLGWAKTDLSSKIDGVVNFEFLSKATGKPAKSLMSW